MRRLALLGALTAAAVGACSPVPVMAQNHAPPEAARTPEGAKPAKRPLTITPFRLAPRHIDRAGLELIEGFEGYSRCAYWDPFGLVETVGFGQTNLFGHSVPSGFCFANRGAAEANLRYSVEAEYEWAIRPLHVTTQHEWDALASFAYNLGAGIFTGSLRFHLQRHELRAAGGEMLQYDHAGGVVLEGLRIRREREVALMLTPERPPKPRCVSCERAHLHALERESARLWRTFNVKRCEARVRRHRRLGPKCSAWGRRLARVNREVRVLRRRVG